MHLPHDYAYAAPIYTHPRPRFADGFALVLVLFILLVIIGAVALVW
ncbi:uncharacterized protein (TIGR01732 family) [Evansella vedderi]|uniref:Uncharacterized protein (TIGR01732 family) n=1 Tax=Evansella vedderi TaxID=38282 RepID=A0ABT9ZVJ6_9BACI|nr:YjcZ family sporulation protein [Evansella vedderi]MDQ0254483.1 uncharacterized protein (TIGR01732 family) [Evansella vedderi]